MRVRANGLSLPDLDSLAALETGRYWTPAKRPGEPLYRPAINNGYWTEDILTNGLVLYVPLWLYSGAKFPSVDNYHHTCTVSGAIWGPRGRTFDGNNDQIALPKSASILTPTSGTFISWCYPTELTANVYVLMCYGSADAAVHQFEIRKDTNFYISVLNRKTAISGFNLVHGSTQLAIDTWYHMAVVSSGAAWSLYLNGVLETPVRQLGDNTGDWFGDMTITDPSVLLVGNGYYQGAYTSPFEGVIGEVYDGTRIFTAFDVLHHYQSTRWRYA